ncbi:hypothetical protein BCO26_1726 [Heyndrickxia coagulans 2-6]|nr:hypothetical protein BCO26_1726 [Heyndrickxia coagulans 2-6]
MRFLCQFFCRFLKRDAFDIHEKSKHIAACAASKAVKNLLVGGYGK